MFIPEAYVTATRQYVAQANSWSLEELSLQVGYFAVIIDIFLICDGSENMTLCQEL